MKKFTYQPETPQKIKETLSPCTPDDIQTYLELCLEITAGQSEHNVLEFPYDFMVNPYAVFYSWLEQAKFQIFPALSHGELKALRHFAKFSVKDFRTRKISSYTISHANPPESTNVYLRNFSQIYAVHQILVALHIYNFLLENYLHESHQLRTEISADFHTTKGTRHQHLHRRFARHNPAAHDYNLWVRDFLLHEGINEGRAPFAQYMRHSFQRDCQHHHPILLPANRTRAVITFTENQKLASKLRRYHYYRFFQPTPAEITFFQELRNDHGDLIHRELLGAGLEKLQQATDLAGRLSQRVVYLSEHRHIVH